MEEGPALWPLPREPLGDCAQFSEGSLQLTHSGVPGKVPDVNSVSRPILPLPGTGSGLVWVPGSSDSAQGRWLQAAGSQKVPGLILKGDIFPSLPLSVTKASEYWDFPHHLTADLKKQSSSSYSPGVQSWSGGRRNQSHTASSASIQVSSLSAMLYQWSNLALWEEGPLCLNPSL